MPPAVAKTFQMRGASPLIFPQRNRDLGGCCADMRCLDYKLRRKFHAAATQIHSLKNFACESTHPAMRIAHPRVEKQIQQRRKSWIPYIFVMPWHRSRLDLSRKAIAHHHFISFAPFFHESRHIAKIIAVVRITHDDERAPRRANSGFQRRSVAALLY